MRYKTMRSIKDPDLHVLLPNASRYNVPQEVLRLGPWRHVGVGELLCLKLEHRITLARHGYVLVRSPPAFAPEYSASIISLDHWRKTKAVASE
jgi:hypothetical protein